MRWLVARPWRLAALALAAVVVAISIVAVALADRHSVRPATERVTTASTVTTTTVTTTAAAPTTPPTPLPSLAPITTNPGTIPTVAPQVSPLYTTPPPPPATTSTTGPPVPCVTSQLALQASPDRASYQPGEPVVLSLALVDVGAVACTVARPSAWATIVVYNPDRTIAWSSDLRAGATLRLEPRQAVVAATAVWAQYECSSPCGSTGPAAAPGTYALQSSAQVPGGTVTSVRVTFSTDAAATTGGTTTTTTTRATSVPPSTAPAAGA